jgi:hypothetical protein
MMSEIRINTNASGSFLTRSFNTLLSLGKIMLRSKTGVKLPHADASDCIVLGNGPSLKESLIKYPDFFKKHKLVCVNSFSITPEYTTLKPSYYVMLDPGLWLGGHETGKKTFEAIQNSTTWNITLFIPATASGVPVFSEISPINKNINVVFFNYTVYTGFRGIGNWFYKNNLAMPQSQNVLVASLFLSVNMGFKNVYLFGADHTWHQTLHVNDDNILCFRDVHFYENEEKVSYRPFYKGAHLKETFSVAEIFATWAKVFSGYFALNNYAETKNCTIYNASEISFIDAFKRIKIQN